MKSKRDANSDLLVHWMQEWTTLGRWQALNSRLSRDAAPLSPGWAQRRSPACSAQHARAADSASLNRIGS